MQELCDFSFNRVTRKIYNLDKLDCDELEDLCFDKITEWKLKNVVGTSEILSIVFVTTESNTRDTAPTYQYCHKSLQELMSARSLIRGLTSNRNQTLREIVQSKIQTTLEVLPEINDIYAG